RKELEGSDRVAEPAPHAVVVDDVLRRVDVDDPAAIDGIARGTVAGDDDRPAIEQAHPPVEHRLQEVRERGIGRGHRDLDRLDARARGAACHRRGPRAVEREGRRRGKGERQDPCGGEPRRQAGGRISAHGNRQGVGKVRFFPQPFSGTSFFLSLPGMNGLQGLARTGPGVRQTTLNWPSSWISPMNTGLCRWWLRSSIFATKPDGASKVWPAIASITLSTSVVPAFSTACFHMWSPM